MPFVVDASLAAGWVLPDEEGSLDILAMLETDYAIVPQLFWFEIYSLLIVAERRKRIVAADVDAALSALHAKPIEIDPVFQGQDILAIARDYELTGYDAAYLELAIRQGVSLATADTALIKAAPMAGVNLLWKK